MKDKISSKDLYVHIGEKQIEKRQAPWRLRYILFKNISFSAATLNGKCDPESLDSIKFNN